MRPKWAEPTTKTIKIPSIQTMLLIVLLVGSAIAIIVVAIVVRMDAPQSAPAAAAQAPPEGPAAWLTANSTFWAAIASGIGAIGTAGALLVAAFTYRHQVAERHRSQAAAVTVLAAKHPSSNRSAIVQVRNDSLLPIYSVDLGACRSDGNELRTEHRDVIAPGGMPLKFDTLYVSGMTAYATFTDSSGTRWKRLATGELSEA